MTEYTTSPEAYGEYVSARERTAYWVQAHSSRQEAFYSPSVPPSEIEGFIPPSPPSDAESSTSLPPKMVLRYNDGRPDVPIAHLNAPFPPHRRGRGNHGPPYGPAYQQTQYPPYATPLGAHPISPIPNDSRYHAARSGSHGSTPSHSHGRRHESLGATAGFPEEIRVLPSRVPSGPAPPHPATSSSHTRGSSHHRSKSLPRNAIDPYSLEEGIEPIPALPHARPLGYPGHPHGGSRVGFVPQSGPPPWVGVHSSNGSGKHSHGHSAHKGPPAIVYAPSQQRYHSRYAPPAILHHQPQRGPNGMIYSHSAPVPIQGGPYPAPMDPNDFEQRGRRDRARSLDPGVVHKVPRSDSGDDSDAESGGSGSTYYVLPNAGQKVHVISPSPEQSVVTATSTTKSPMSSPRKPFFQRLFNFAKIAASSSGGSSKGSGRKLQRRHSTGDSGRPRGVPSDPVLQSEVAQ